VAALVDWIEVAVLVDCMHVAAVVLADWIQGEEAVVVDWMVLAAVEVVVAG
jgi:hypothetical protein